MEKENREAVEQNDTVEIDLGQLFRAIWKNIWFVLLCMVLLGGLTLCVNVFVIHPTYRVNFTAYVNNHSSSDQTSSLNSADTSASQSLAYTYAAIMSSRSVLVDAAKQAKISYEDVDELSACVSTEVQDSTQLVDVHVTMQDPDEAYAFAKAIADIAPDYISEIVEGSSMKVVVQPEEATKPYSPHISRNTAIGIILGALIAMVIIVIRELTDTRVKNEDSLEEEFGISVIGTIPDFESAGSSKEYGYYGHYYQ